MNYKIDILNHFTDERGSLVEFIQSNNLAGKSSDHFGQIYFVTFNEKGVTRGNHYHNKPSESFTLIFGRVKVILEDIQTKERIDFILDSQEKPFKRLSIGPEIAHTFISLADYAILLNYADKVYDPKDEDKYSYILS